VIKQERKIKGIQKGKKEAGLSLFSDYMSLYFKDPKILLDLINTFSNVAG
jgi:hypothetical protein